MATWTPAGPLTACVNQNVAITPTTDQPNGAQASSGNQLIEFALTPSAGSVSPTSVLTGNPAQFTVPSGASTVTAVERQWQRFGTHGIYTGLLTAAPRTGDAQIDITLNGALVTPGTTTGHHIHFGDFDLQFNGTNVLANYGGVFQGVAAVNYVAGEVYSLRITGTTVEVLRNAVVVFTYTQSAVLTDNERAGFSLSSGTATSADHTAFLPNIALSGTFGALATVVLNVTGVTAAITPSANQTVPVGGTFNFQGTPVGGTWTMSSNGSGGSVSSAGLYTAGSSPGTDVLVYEVSTGCSASVSVQVIPAFFFQPTSPLPQTNVGAAFSYDFSADVTGGVAPYSYTIAGGAIPPGLTLDSSTGILSGTPSAGGTFSFVVRVTDATGRVAQCQVTLVVEPALIVLPASPTVFSGSLTTFSANVPDGTWSSSDCPNSLGTTGVFVAPSNLTGANITCTVTYTTPAGQTQTRVVTIEPALQITPLAPVIVGGSQQQFSANLPDVTWTANCGVIDSTGLFQAPEVAQPLVCTIAALAPSGQSGTLAVTIYPRLTAEPAGMTVSLGASGYLQVTGGSGNYTITQPGCGTIAPTGVPGQYIFTGETATALTDGAICTPGAAGCSVIVCDALTGACVTVPLAVTEKLTLSPSPALGEDCIHAQVDSQVSFTLTGGSGQYAWNWIGDGHFSRSPIGLFNTGTQAGEVTINVRDLLTGETAEVKICVEGATACVIAKPCPQPTEIVPCCETTLDCGSACHLEVPGLFVNTPNKTNAAPHFQGIVGATLNSDGSLTGSGGRSGASADVLLKGQSGSVTFFVTPSMLTFGNQIAVGWSDRNLDERAETITFAAVISSSGLQVWQNGIAAAKRDSIRVGDEVKVAATPDGVTIYHQGVEVYTFDSSSCNNLVLDFALTGAVTIGGPAAASWVVATPGSPDVVGSITAAGRFTAPSVGGRVTAAAYVGSSILYHTINITEPTAVELHPNDVWTGGLDSVWMNVEKIRPGQKPKLASDGSPSRDVSPNAVGFLGDYTVEGVEFNFKRELNEITIEGGTIETEEQDIMVEITFTLAQTRNANLLKIFNPNATVNRIGGATQIVVGRQKCNSRKFNLLLVKESKCGGGKYDTFYVPNARVTSGVTHTFKRGELVTHEVTVTGYVDLACSRMLYMQTLETPCTEASCEAGPDGPVLNDIGHSLY